MPAGFTNEPRRGGCTANLRVSGARRKAFELVSKVVGASCGVAPRDIKVYPKIAHISQISSCPGWPGLALEPHANHNVFFCRGMKFKGKVRLEELNQRILGACLSNSFEPICESFHVRCKQAWMRGAPAADGTLNADRDVEPIRVPLVILDRRKLVAHDLEFEPTAVPAN